VEIGGDGAGLNVKTISPEEATELGWQERGRRK
jgi:hypothetical protein